MAQKESPAKRQRVDETVEDIIARTAAKAASEAAEKCNAFWIAKTAEKQGDAAKVPAAVMPPHAPDDKTVDEACMSTAAASARVGIRLEHGGPFGASIVRDGVVISCAHNMVLHNSDPTCHAEMTAIRQACKALGTHDLSDCKLYTTCEPCPMCWGAVHWSRLNKAYIGVDRYTAAKYGFDDKVFYDEIDAKTGAYGWRRMGPPGRAAGAPAAADEKHIEKNMVELYDGILRKECEALFTDPDVNRTYARRYAQQGQSQALHKAAKEAFPDAGVKCLVTTESNANTSLAQHENFMRMAVAAVQRSAKNGMSKEREPFGAVIVKDGKVVASACNSVCSSRDSTATAEINAIQEATRNLGTHILEGCELYTTVQPDVMSLGAILWSRISRVYCGVTQKFAAQYGFEEGTLHFKDLMEDRASNRLIEVVKDVSKPECEAVFKEWSDRNGVIY